MSKKSFSQKEAKEVGELLGIKWNKWDVEQFRMGMDVELEHGTVSPSTNVTDDDPIMTGKIALAHLNELPNYYTLLAGMEKIGEGMLDISKVGAKIESKVKKEAKNIIKELNKK